MKLRYKVIIVLFAVIMTEWWYLAYKSEKIVVYNEDNEATQFVVQESDVILIEEGGDSQNTPKTTEDEVKSEEENLNIEDGLEMLNIIYKVPFTPQAPYAEWSDPVHQDGCEEAVSLMAVLWARGEVLNQSKAKEEIVAASDYQAENFGEYRDASVKDTAKRIIKGYFEYNKVEVKTVITAKDIIQELIKGNIIIIPTDGQKLDNLYYTPPGPERHMLVVIGYDEENQEFITNDPGTKRGENYRYSEKVLFDAIRDYHTGYHAPIDAIEKNMIVIGIDG